MTDEDLRVEIDVWPCHWKTLLIFDAMGTQWREGGMDYAALPVAAGLLGLRLRPRRFAALRRMEAAALGVLAERRNRAEKRA